MKEILKTLLTDYTLHEQALDEWKYNRYDKAEKACKKHAKSLNSYWGCGSFTPLHAALSSNNTAYIVMTLKYGANPNLYEHRDFLPSIKPLQLEITRKAVSHVKILAIYGTDTQDIIFPKGQSAVKAYRAGYKIFVKKQCLKKYNELLQDETSLITQELISQIEKISQELSDLFTQAAQRENIADFKRHYQEEAEHYRAFFQKLLQPARHKHNWKFFRFHCPSSSGHHSTFSYPLPRRHT